MPIVYDAIKTLKQRGRIYSDNGMFFVTEEHKQYEQQAQIRRLQRQITEMMEKLQHLAPGPQMALAMEGGK